MGVYGAPLFNACSLFLSAGRLELTRPGTKQALMCAAVFLLRFARHVRLVYHALKTECSAYCWRRLTWLLTSTGVYTNTRGGGSESSCPSIHVGAMQPKMENIDWYKKLLKNGK